MTFVRRLYTAGVIAQITMPPQWPAGFLDTTALPAVLIEGPVTENSGKMACMQVSRLVDDGEHSVA